MASTNKTTNYELSQFLGTDKPAWLSDYNSDMNKIDTQMKANADGVTAAAGVGTSNTAAIGTLSSLTTEAKTSLVAAVNEVDANADTAQGTANSANTAAGTALGKANEALAGLEKFNFTVFNNYAANDITATGCTVSNANITVASDSTGSIFKVYGTANVSTTSALNGTLALASTGITPDSDFDIICAGIFTKDSSYDIRSVTLTVKTTGVIEVKSTLPSNTTGVFRLTPCLYFAKDFGDEE